MKFILLLLIVSIVLVAFLIYISKQRPQISSVQLQPKLCVVYVDPTNLAYIESLSNLSAAKVITHILFICNWSAIPWEPYNQTGDYITFANDLLSKNTDYSIASNTPASIPTLQKMLTLECINSLNKLRNSYGTKMLVSFIGAARPNIPPFPPLCIPPNNPSGCINSPYFAVPDGPGHYGPRSIPVHEESDNKMCISENIPNAVCFQGISYYVAKLMVDTFINNIPNTKYPNNSILNFKFDGFDFDDENYCGYLGGAPEFGGHYTFLQFLSYFRDLSPNIILTKPLDTSEAGIGRCCTPVCNISNGKVFSTNLAKLINFGCNMSYGTDPFQHFYSKIDFTPETYVQGAQTYDGGNNLKYAIPNILQNGYAGLMLFLNPTNDMLTQWAKATNQIN